MLLVYLFTVSVISMALLVMYKNDRHALKKMMARGRCGLPGYPNPGFMADVPDPAAAFNKGNGKEKDKCPDPFDSQLETLSKIIVEKRKQIVDSKGRVDIAETTVKNLHLSSIKLRRRYQSIMEELRLEMESAEDECKDLNTFIAKANNLKQKFFQPDENECNEENANAYSDNKASKESWGELPMCCNQKPKPKPEKKHDCHPPVPELCNRKFPSSCACPEKSLNPLATCRPPPPNCGKKCENTDSNKYNDNCDPCSKPKKNCSQTSAISSGRCSTQSMVKRTNPSVGSCCSPPQPPSNQSSQPCPAPLPSLLPRRLSSNNQSLPASRKSSATTSLSVNSEFSRNSSATSQRTSVSFQGQNPCPEPNPCCCPCGKPPTSTYVKKPPYSSFLGERMPAAPIQRRIKQTVFTECEYEGGDDDETGSTIVTVRSSSITFPPSCCTSAYEEFLSAALKANKPPPIKLPTIVDECDPCAEIPREISEWEDTENVTHTCGTQTTSEEERRRRQEDVMNMYYENDNRNRCS